MRRLLPWVIGLLVGVALGASGTYAAERYSGEDHSRLCRAWTHFTDNAPTSPNGTTPPATLYKTGFYSKAYLEYWDQVFTIRNKACVGG